MLITVPGTGQHKPAYVGSTASAMCCIAQPCPCPRLPSSASPACSCCTQNSLPASPAPSSTRARQWHAGTQATCSPHDGSRLALHSRVTLDCVPSPKVCSRDSPRHRQVFKHRTVKDALKMQSEIVNAVSLFQSPLLFSVSRVCMGGGAVRGYLSDCRCIQTH